MTGRLFLVGTPIGNLSDWSPRAVETLGEVDFIAAEDTRVTAKLLNHFDIKKPMVSYFEHNKRERGRIIIDRILEGENCAIVTDAGMPCISDPGEDLVKLCRENNIDVISVPGPTAFATALAVSGMDAGRFTFEGFLSVNKQSRREHLDSLKDEKRTMVFYEAPHKLRRTLDDFQTTFGNREICIVKELTKIHETVFRTNICEAVKFYEENEPRGEYVACAQDEPVLEAVKLAKELVDKGMSVNDAAKTVASETGIKKSTIYKLLV